MSHPILFAARRRDWKALPGHQNVPEGPMIEVRSLPGQVVGWGLTQEAALKHALAAIKEEIRIAGSYDVWWDQAWAELTPDERSEALKVGGHAWFEREKPTRADGFDYAYVGNDHVCMLA